MIAVVTGCAGFIGSHLCELLLEHGHHVVGIDDLSRGSLTHVPEGVDFRRLDIRDIAPGPPLHGADVVFHLAAIATTPATIREPLRAVSVNVGGTTSMLEAARSSGVGRFVNISSNVVYGEPTPYRGSKLAAEDWCTVYAYLYKLPTVSLRLSNTFGSLRADPENCIMAMRAMARAKEYVWVTGDGEQTRDFTHVRDVARACLLAAESTYTGPPLDICSGQPRRLNEVAEWFGVPIHHVPDRPGDTKHLPQDFRPAQEVLGFTAEVPFWEGMKAYL